MNEDAYMQTECVIAPKTPLDGFDSLSVPVYRASTIVFPDAQSYRTRAQRSPDGYTYGLSGTPTTRTLEAQLSQFNNAIRSVIVPSGMAAISMSMLAVLKTGDHLLIADNVYPPVKQFAQGILQSMGVVSEYFNPLDLADFSKRLQVGKTRMVWVESPGSTSMELCDIPQICKLAHEAKALVGCDNTWATGLLCKPLDLGVDVVAEALTKYAGGHSDLLLGSISFKSMEFYEQVRNSLNAIGVGVSPDECSLALRGIQTMSLRMQHVGDKSLVLAKRLQSHPGIGAVLHPALEQCPGHDIWRRDFKASAGLFSLRLDGVSDSTVDKALDLLETFAIGASWGGTRSLMAPMNIDSDRSVLPHEKGATYLRLSIGLENVEDLYRDLKTAADLFAKELS